MNQFKKVLVLAPHTDDGELGCGASIHKFSSEGAEVFYVAFSICTRSLPEYLHPMTLAEEVKRATELLGVSKENLILYDYDVRHFPAIRQTILEEMVALEKQIKPDLVLMPCSTDIHQDHQTIYAEGLRAFKRTTILGYELPWNNLSFTTNTFVTLNESNVQQKIKALNEYESQKTRSYLNADFIRSLAKTRGVQIAADYAEAFELIRWII
ncbi:MAG: PIG-L family deacetylase [Chitinophagales bacterium]|mgnify:FL=1|jgi:LmbE family N-acetylglucosaminyl deacetylase